MSQHSFEVHSEWKGGLSGHGIIKSKTWESPYSAPADLNGAGVGTNPEELLAGAAGGCLLITLAAVLQFQGIKGFEFRNRTEITASNEGGLKIEGIKHFLTVRSPMRNLNEIKPRIETAVARAEKVCMISQAIRQNITISIELRFEEEA